ncbi:MAG: ribosomal L7Ae/L30e/S12e/Gadd45 family protein [Eubacterium sp.]|nr:ribosomal L7Ae/L30e/S12e/Gadd45 family protein [Eubacterium sp.]
MTGNNKALSMIGLASRAGAVKSGEFSVEKAVKSGRGKLVLVASDASDNTKKMVMDMCRFYKVPIRIFGTKEELGRWSGKAYRASICILDEGFAKSVINSMEV